MSDKEPQHSKGSQREPLLYGPDDKPILLSAKLEQSTRKAQKELSSHPRGFQAHKKAIAALLGGATILSAIVVFVPRPTVIPSDPSDLTNPFSASFTITNNNFVPLAKVTAKFAIEHVLLDAPANVQIKGSDDFGTRFVKPEWEDRYLAMDDRFTISPTQFWRLEHVKEAHIAVVVTYRPWFLPFETRKNLSIQNIPTDQRASVLV